MTSLRRPFRRALAVTLALVLPAGLWLCTGQPLLTAYGDAGARIAQADDRLARAQAIAVGREDLARQLAALKARMAGARTQLAEDSPALAAAGLQSRLKKLVEEHGGELKSVQALPERDEEGGLRRVTVRVALTCSVQGLRGILHAIETGTPFLFVDNLDLRGRTSRATEDAGGGAVLDVRFDAAGLLGRPKGGA